MEIEGIGNCCSQLCLTGLQRFKYLLIPLMELDYYTVKGVAHMYSLSEEQTMKLDIMIYCDGFDVGIRKPWTRTVGNLVVFLKKKVIKIYRSNPTYMYNANMSKDEWVSLLERIENDPALSRLRIDKKTFKDEARYNPEKDSRKINSEFITYHDYSAFRAVVLYDPQREIKANVVFKGRAKQYGSEKYLNCLKYEDVDMSGVNILPSDWKHYITVNHKAPVSHNTWYEVLFFTIVGIPVFLFLFLWLVYTYRRKR